MGDSPQWRSQLVTPECQGQSGSAMYLHLSPWASDASMVDVAASGVARRRGVVAFVKDGHAQLAAAESIDEASRSCLGAAVEA